MINEITVCADITLNKMIEIYFDRCYKYEKEICSFKIGNLPIPVGDDEKKLLQENRAFVFDQVLQEYAAKGFYYDHEFFNNSINVLYQGQLWTDYGV